MPPPLDDTSATGAKSLDVTIMVSLPGTERTEAQWRALVDGAGLRLALMTRVEDLGTCLLEAAAR